MKNKWLIILDNLSRNPRDLHTIPMVEREPTWFYAYTDGTNIYVEKARENSNSGLRGKRRLTFSEFKKIYPIFVRRDKGEDIGKEGSQVTHNQSYWYSICKFCINE